MNEKNLNDARRVIETFAKENNIKVFEVKNKEKEMIEEFYDIVKKKLNLDNAIEWTDKLESFLIQAKELGAKMFYLCGFEVEENDISESESFKSEKILGQNIGNIPFLILSCPLNGVNHFFEIKTDWFEEAKELYESGPDENEIDEDDEWEDLEEEDIEAYALRIIKHPEFPKREVNSEDALKFIKENFQDICDELDKWGLDLVADKVETKTHFGEDQ